MATPNRARNSHELPEKTRRSYVQRHFAARNARPIPLVGARLIYFDQDLAADLLEHIASSETGRAFLTELPGSDPADLLFQRNQRAVLSQLIDQAEDLEAGGIIDLHQSNTVSRRMSWMDVHPDQAVAIRGTIISAKDVQPSSLRLEVDGTSVRAFVKRDHFLHLNQTYLTGWPITVVGKIRSVPHVEIISVAVGITPPTGSSGKGSS
jgi:hypothetical protein